MKRLLLAALAACASLCALPAQAATLRAATTAELTAAIRTAAPGDDIALACGDYVSPSFGGRKIAAGKVRLVSADPACRPRLVDTRIDGIQGFGFAGLEFLSRATTALYAPGVSNLDFDGVTVSGQGPLAGQLGVDLRAAADVKFNAVQVRDLERGLKIYQSRRVTVQNGEFTRLGADGVDVNGGSATSDILVDHNRFHDFAMVALAHPDAVQLDTTGATDAMYNITVSNNLMYSGTGTKFQGAFLSDPAGLGLKAVLNFVVAGNVAINLMYNGVYPSAGQGVISANYVAGVDNDSWVKWGGNYTVTGNTVQPVFGVTFDPSNTVLPGRISATEGQARIAAWMTSVPAPVPTPTPTPVPVDPTIALKAQIAALQAALAQATTERDGALVQLAAVTAERDTLKGQLAQTQAERDAANVQVAQLTQERDALAAKWSALLAAANAFFGLIGR